VPPTPPLLSLLTKSKGSSHTATLAPATKVKRAQSRTLSSSYCSTQGCKAGSQAGRRKLRWRRAQQAPTAPAEDGCAAR
jgi:hypothetical protein